MSEKYRPYIGKDGNKYSDVWERDASNRRYEQRQKLIEETLNIKKRKGIVQKWKEEWISYNDKLQNQNQKE